MPKPQLEIEHNAGCTQSYWRLNSPSKDYMEGRVSRGVCINCGVEYDFPNSTDGRGPWTTSERYQKMMESRMKGAHKGGKIRNQ